MTLFGCCMVYRQKAGFDRLVMRVRQLHHYQCWSGCIRYDATLYIQIIIHVIKARFVGTELEARNMDRGNQHMIIDMSHTKNILLPLKEVVMQLLQYLDLFILLVRYNP